MQTLIRDGSNYIFSGSHANGAAFEPIYLHPSLKDIRMVVVSAGITKIEFTISSIEQVKTNTALWYEERDSVLWYEEESSITTTAYRLSLPVTAIRLTGNAATYELLAN